MSFGTSAAGTLLSWSYSVLLGLLSILDSLRDLVLLVLDRSLSLDLLDVDLDLLDLDRVLLPLDLDLDDEDEELLRAILQLLFFKKNQEKHKFLPSFFNISKYQSIIANLILFYIV